MTGLIFRDPAVPCRAAAFEFVPDTSRRSGVCVELRSENHSCPRTGQLDNGCVSSRKHPLRVTVRAIWFGAELLLAAIRYIAMCSFTAAEQMPARRARWLQASSRRVLRIINVHISISGPLPGRGLLVSNHLSYVDILTIAALSPSCFVSKHEIRSWPVFGWFARLAGTIFVNRQKRFQTATAASEMELALQRDVLLVLFPEGTNTDGASVLPFKSSLLEPVIRTRPELTVAAIRYELDDGDPAYDVCYWGDMVLVPHMFKLLSKGHVRAYVKFAPFEQSFADRKQLAHALREEVLRLRASP